LFLLLGAVFDKSLKIPGKWNNTNVAEGLKKKTNEKDRVVHSEKSRLNPVKVIKYLGKYIQRVAISNRRIEPAEGEDVCFSYKDCQDKGKRKKMALKPVEFIRRFLLHVLPQRFCKVRYYGILSIKNNSHGVMN
jgi:hypothetical protein